MTVRTYILALLKKTPFNDITKDFDNIEIVKGAGTTFTLKIVGLVFSYIFNILFARLYGAEVMGLFALAIMVAGIFLLFGKIGTQTSLIRLLAQHAGQGNYRTVKLIYKNVIQLVLPLSIFFAILFYILSPWIANNIFHKSRLIVPFKITAFVLPFGALIGVNTAVLQGLKKIKEAFIFSTVLPPILNIFGLIGLTYFVMKNYLTPIYVNLLSVIIGSLFSLLIWLKVSRNLVKIENNTIVVSVDKKEILKISLPMFMTSFMLLIMGSTDIFMLGIFRNVKEIGVYQVALKLSLFTSFTLSVVNSIAAPKFSELYWRGDEDKLKETTRFSSKLIFWSSLPIFIITILFAKQILSIFGREFIIGSTALIILSLGQFVNASCGSVGFLLDMTGEQNVLRNIIILGVIINIILNLFLIPLYGINGASVATSLSTVIWNFMASFAVLKTHGFWAGYFKDTAFKR